MKRLLVLLTLCALPLQAQWLLGPERLLTSPTTGTSVYNSGAAVAASDTNDLAAWLFRPPQNPRLPGTLYVMPFGDDGPQRTTQLAIGAGFSAPHVAWNGTEYLVASTVDAAVTLRRLDRDGTPLDAAKTVTPSHSIGQLPVGSVTRVLPVGSQFLIVAGAAAYAGSNIASSLEAVTVSAAGDVIHDVFSFGDGETLNDAAMASARGLVLSKKGRSLIGRTITSLGEVSEPFAITSDAVTMNAAVASDGFSFLAAWIDDLGRLRAAPIDQAGNVGAATTIATNAAYAPPAVGWNGRDFIIGWADATKATLFATLGGPPVEVSAPSLPPPSTLSLASRNGRTALVASQNVITSTVIGDDFGFRQFPLSVVTLDHFAPRLVGDTLFHLEGAFGPPYSLYRGAQLLRTDVSAYDVSLADANAVGWFLTTMQAGMTVFSPGAFSVSEGSATGLPSLASNGRTRLLAFVDHDAVFVGRVGESGAPLDLTPVQISAGNFGPLVNVRAVWRGDAFVVVWEEPRNGSPEAWLVKSVRVGEDGTHGPEVVMFDTPPGSSFYDVVASGGATALLWTVPFANLTELHVTRVDPESPAATVTATQVQAPSTVSLMGTAYGFDVLDVDGSRVAYRTALSRDVKLLLRDERLGAMPAADVVFVYREGAPRSILYSKGQVIAARDLAKSRRKVAAAP